MKLPVKTFNKQFEIQHGRCFYCGCDLNKIPIEIDHKIPFSKTRDGRKTNLCLTCKDCNRLKSDKFIFEFKKLVKEYYPEKLIRGKFYFEFINI